MHDANFRHKKFFELKKFVEHSLIKAYNNQVDVVKDSNTMYAAQKDKGWYIRWENFGDFEYKE